jgi:hypothetical protein
VVSRCIADEVILVPIHKKAGTIDLIYTMNQVGGRIWELIDGERSIEDITDLIVEEFAVETENAAADLIAFLRELERVGAVRVV